MNTLTPVFDAELVSAAQGIPSEKVEELRVFLLETPLWKPFAATIAHATDESGDVYREVEFVVDVRFKRDGDDWIAGGGFALNVSALIRDLESILAVAS